jgi:hypothetical protein
MMRPRQNGKNTELDNLERELNDALRSHVHRTGGLMVGDVIEVGDGYSVRITGYTPGGELEMHWEDRPD